MNLDIRCEMASFFVTSRTSSEQTNAPDYYVHITAQSFIETVLGMTVEDFCMKFDAFSILGLRGLIWILFRYYLITIPSGLAKNDNEHQTLLKKRIHLLIAADLCKD